MKHPTSPDELEPLSEKELGDLLELVHPRLDPFAQGAPEKAKLVDKVKKGGQGVWGQVPMPPNTQVPDADVKALVKWILSQK